MKRSNRKDVQMENWVSVDIEILHETEKAVLLDFGADRGCTHETWVPKKHFRTIIKGAFEHTQITRKWVSFKNLWAWI